MEIASDVPFDESVGWKTERTRGRGKQACSEAHLERLPHGHVHTLMVDLHP